MFAKRLCLLLFSFSERILGSGWEGGSGQPRQPMVGFSSFGKEKGAQHNTTALVHAAEEQGQGVKGGDD